MLKYITGLLGKMAEGTVKGRAVGAGAGNPSDLAISQLRSMLGMPISALALSSGAATTTSDNLDTILSVTTGAVDAIVTLYYAASAGNGTPQYIFKADSGQGRVIIKDAAGNILAILNSRYDVVGMFSDGTNWLPLFRRTSRHPGLSIASGGKWWAPYPVTALATPAKDTLMVFLVDVPEDLTFDAMGLKTSAAITGGSGRTFVYGINPSNPHSPEGAPLLYTCSAARALTAGGEQTFSFADSYIPRGQCWLGCWIGASGTVSTMYGIQQNMPGTGLFYANSISEAIASSGEILKGYTVSSTYSSTDALPATFPTPTDSVGNGSIPSLSLRIAS